MPNIAAGKLEDTIRRLLEACGAPAGEAETVARHVVDANLCGHDSHGAIQIPIYIDRVEKGHIVPGAPFEIVRRARRPRWWTGIGASATRSLSGR